jgi:hypothetical protein
MYIDVVPNIICEFPVIRLETPIAVEPLKLPYVLDVHIMDNKSYNLYISSNDELSGSNNNCTFNVQWEAFLPKGYKVFKVQFYGLSVGAYGDSTTLYGGAQVVLNCHSKNFSILDVPRDGRGRF